MSGEFWRDSSLGASLAGRQLDGLAVRCRPRGGVPFIHAPLELLARDEFFPCDEFFQGRQPVLVVAGAVVRRAALGRGGELGGERVRPFAPGEDAARVQGNRYCEGLRLPRRLEDRPRVVARHGARGGGCAVTSPPRGPAARSLRSLSTRPAPSAALSP